jgi:hypothetical protein
VLAALLSWGCQADHLRAAPPGSSSSFFLIERDGAVGDIVEGSKTTYGSEAVRLCVARLVSALRFPRGREEGRPEVEITLEVTPRR